MLRDMVGCQFCDGDDDDDVQWINVHLKASLA